MAPFAEHLGINAQEFLNLKPLFSSDKSRVLLVEGQIDVYYFEFLRTHACVCEKLLSSIEIVPYGGKDTLKHTQLIQFVFRKFDYIFVTYDLDAEKDINPALNRIALSEKQHCSLGIAQPGKDCIEGLLPTRVLNAVNGRETDLIMQLSSSERRKAKDALKKKYLAEFRSHTDYTSDELKHLSKIITRINTWFADRPARVRKQPKEIGLASTSVSGKK